MHPVDQDPGAELERALLTMDRVSAARILAGGPPGETAASGIPGLDPAAVPPIPIERIDELLVPVLRRIGNDWGAGRAALSQVYMAARIADEIIGRGEPQDRPVRVETPRIGIAVLEDHHELGKRIVSMSLRAAGYPHTDFGAGVGVDALADRVEEEGVEVLLVSTLMLRAAIRVEALANRLHRRQVRPRLFVGGAPYLFDSVLWTEVGADAMGRSSADAIALVQDHIRRGSAPVPPGPLTGDRSRGGPARQGAQA